jgi:hypothetical protein
MAARIQISNTPTELGDESVKRIRRRNALWPSAIFVFVLFGGAGAFFIRIALSLLSIDGPGYGLLFVACGTVCVFFAVLFGMRRSPEYRKLQEDLARGHGVVWEVVANQVFSLIPNGTWEALAFDCGDSTLILQGNWLAEESNRFPSLRFELVVLPESGYVVSLRNCEEVVEPTERLDGCLPFSPLEIKYVEAKVVEGSILTAVLWRAPTNGD